MYAHVLNFVQEKNVHIFRQKSTFLHPINLPDIKLLTKYLGQIDGHEDNADLNDMDISGAMVYQKIMDRF